MQPPQRPAAVPAKQRARAIGRGLSAAGSLWSHSSTDPCGFFSRGLAGGGAFHPGAFLFSAGAGAEISRASVGKRTCARVPRPG